MRFADIVGQKEIIDNLVKIAGNGRISHSILFTEEPGFGALPLALAFVQYRLCHNPKDGDSCGQCPACNKISKLIHPDLHFALPVNSTKKVPSDKKPVTDLFIEDLRRAILSNPYLFEEEWYEEIGMEEKSGLISVNESAAIIRKLSLMSYEGGDKFLIMWLPERMNRECANKLLKILEEPTPGTNFILISQEPGMLLSTIISRCQIIVLKPEEESYLSGQIVGRWSIDASEADYWAGVASGSYGKALRLFKGSSADERFFEILSNIFNYSKEKNLPELIKTCDDIGQMGREKQKQFCAYALGVVRKCYMLSVDSPDIAYIHDSERDPIKRWSTSINPQFWPKAYNILNKAIDDLERNVNSKFIFADISNRFFLSL